MKMGRIEIVIFFFAIFHEAVKGESSCEKQRRQVLLSDTRDVRQYLPRCTASGKYKSLQCRSDYCWCVDDNGKRVSEDMPTKRANSLACSFMKRKRGLSACENELQKANNQPAGSLGIFYPKCKFDGTYQPMQCNESTGWCWCVDVNTGQQLDWETQNKDELNCE